MIVVWCEFICICAAHIFRVYEKIANDVTDNNYYRLIAETKRGEVPQTIIHVIMFPTMGNGEFYHKTSTVNL